MFFHLGIPPNRQPRCRPELWWGFPNVARNASEDLGVDSSQQIPKGLLGSFHHFVGLVQTGVRNDWMDESGL